VADTIFTPAETPPATSQADADTHGWGMRFTVSANSSCVGGRAWVHSTGRPDTFFWQLWNDTSNTLIAEVDLNTLPAAAEPGWLSFTSADFTTPGDVALVDTDVYVVNVFFQTGDGVFTDPAPSLPIGTGVVSADTGVFNNAEPQTNIPDTTNATWFFADVEVEEDSATVTGTLDLNIPAPLMDAEGEVTASGSLNLTVPALQIDEVGLVTTAGVLDLNIPALLMEAEGALPVSGTLNLNISIEIDLDGVSAAGGSIMGPCGWSLPEPLCCESWEALDPAIQAAAQDYGATIMWAATGRRFGLCEVTVRPCGMKRCDDGLGEFSGWSWSGGTWMPYIFNGMWFNCVCPGICCCEPRCQVRLQGPVDSIIEVIIDGVVIDPSAYRVDDKHWLVRTDGDCWPFCANLDTDEPDQIFTVTYMRGDPIPNTILTAASTLACEWGKACTGDGTCRLGNRVTNLARNGVTIDMTSPQELLSAGLTGIFEVDQIINAWNPYGKKQRGQIKAPELNWPRTVTSP